MKKKIDKTVEDNEKWRYESEVDLKDKIDQLKTKDEVIADLKESKDSLTLKIEELENEKEELE